MSIPLNQDDLPAFARTSAKRTSKIEARVTDELKLALARRVHELGMTESDYIDRLVSCNLFGVDHVLSIEQERIKQVVGMSALVQTGARHG